MCVCAGQRITENRIMKETTITIKHAVAATRRQKWQQRNTNVNLNFFHNCRSDRSGALSPSHSHLRRRIVCNAARGCDVRVRACVDVCMCVQCSVAMFKMDIVVKCFFDFVSTVDTTETK